MSDATSGDRANFNTTRALNTRVQQQGLGLMLVVDLRKDRRAMEQGQGIPLALAEQAR